MAEADILVLGMLVVVRVPQRQHHARRAQLLADQIERQASAEAGQDDERAPAPERGGEIAGERMVEPGALGRIARAAGHLGDAREAAALLEARLMVDHLISLRLDVA